jgi:hypothetical protein
LQDCEEHFVLLVVDRQVIDRAVDDPAASPTWLRRRTAGHCHSG